MKTRNKIVMIVMITAAFMMILAGCGNANKTYKIGVSQLVEHEALDAATKGFKAAVTDKLGEDHVKFEVKNAQGEQNNCTTIATGFVNEKVDLIMANATPALQTAAAATKDSPILGTSVTDYGAALNIKNFSGKTGNNVSGTSDLAPLDKQADMIKEICPKAKTVGILYCSAEANSAYQVTEISKCLKKLGMTPKKYAAADSNEVQSVTTKAAGECDALYVPTDNTMANSTETIKNIVLNKKVPLIAGEEGICKGCGVATLSISYYDLGYQTGLMAVEVLKDGKKPGDMEIKTADKVTKEFNPVIAKKLGIKIPKGYKAIK